MLKMRSLATAAASTALVLGMAAPAFAGGDTGHGGLTLYPSSGGPGTHVEVKANCKDGGHGTVASDAFSRSRAHHPRHHDHDNNHHDGDRRHHRKDTFASAMVMSEGLTVGKKYQVTGYCKNHQPLTGTFTFTGGVGGAANAGLGGLATGTESGLSSTTTAAGVAGGLAVAGTAGYFLVWRRRTAGNQA
ncbi:hypothetical protein JJV70_22130 [Streptomyces sp. JJ66]|uniref:hypothetical protein n=1 Tax=Streptomyces sp. JJ66 TaxID=2803843 RepID=UPI001C57209A|nr:hypothetical protein [Streptomyces sp. JJ66]MBW1604744.1 hypothetical protein [Streptomyces sp. JJ66]